jgi:hypothetical protein
LPAEDAPIGYRGKLAERQQARLLRSSGRPLAEIDRLLAEGRASSAGCRSGSS